MLKRSQLNYLKEWFYRPNRKPLIIKGARQVGKSTLVQLFAKQQNLELITINLEQSPQDAALFISNDPKIIINLISVKINKILDLKNTLLFLDEVQKTPQVILSLRYFYECMPELPIICTGSLLDLALININFSMPVGRVEYLYLGVMSFQEFLLALGNNQLLDFIKNYKLTEQFPLALHNKLLELLKIYFIVGGLPESVASYVNNNNFLDPKRILANLVNSYQEDFAKYASLAQQQYMRLVFNKVPKIIGEKFKYSNISKEYKSTVIKSALDNLVLAKIINKINHTNANGVPLGAEINENHFKTYFLDVGLISCILDLNILDFMQYPDLNLVNSGKIAEQFVAQHLLYLREYYEEPKLYYWDKEKKGSSAEIDFVIALNGQIIPIEVKSGSSGTLKSLHYFLKEKKLRLGVKFSSQMPSVLQEQALLSSGEKITYKLVSLPLYLVEESERLLNKY